MSKRLYVGNLSYGTTEMGLRELFEQSGPVAEVKVVLDRDTGRPRGFAFVEMTTDEGAEQAISQLNGRDLDGRALKVNVAEERSSGGGGRRGNSRAGW
jgi:cold-inducible RNA-binding protein